MASSDGGVDDWVELPPRSGTAMAADGGVDDWQELPAKPSEKSVPETMMRGVAQGALFGFPDELTAGVGAAKDVLTSEVPTGLPLSRPGVGGYLEDLKDKYGNAYSTYIDKIRREDAKARDESPWISGLSEAGGMVGSAVTGPGAMLAPVKGAGALANMGRIAGAGGVMGAGMTEAPVTSPEFYKDVGIGAGTNLAGAGLLKGAGAATRAVAPKSLAKGVAKVLGHVPEEDFEHYWKNNARLRGQKEPEVAALKDEIDKGVAGVEGKYTSARDKAQAAKEQLDALYQERQKALSGHATSLGEARELGVILDQEKQVLGEMSKSADKALDESGAEFKKRDLLSLLDQIGAKQGDDLISESAQNAVNKFHGTRQRIEDAAPDVIDAKKLRNYLRQIREDIDFEHTSGQFDERLNRMRKEFAAAMSGALKDQSPEYAQYMAEMAKRSQSLEGMSNYFGKPERAIASFERVRKGAGPTSQVPEDVLRQHAEVTGNKDLVAKLDSWKRDRELMGRMKNEDLRGELYPAESQSLSAAQADEAAAKASFDKVGRLTQPRTQSVVENQGRLGEMPNVEDKRALQALSAETGADYLTSAKDRGVLRRLGSDRTRGARMAVSGAAAGSAVAHGIGAPIELGAAAGSGAGLALDKYSGQLTRKAIDSAATIASNFERFYKERGLDALVKDLAPVVAAAQKGYPASILTIQLLTQRNPEVAAALREGPKP